MDIDERLETLVRSSETLANNIKALGKTVNKMGEVVATLTLTITENEKRWEKMRHVLLAALDEFAHDGQPPEEQ